MRRNIITTRALNVARPGCMIRLTLGGEAFDQHRVPQNETLSLSLIGTNGQLPRRALQSTLLDTVVKSTTSRLGCAISARRRCRVIHRIGIVFTGGC